MIERPRVLDEIRRGLNRSQVVALVGPRQSGKTTLARQLVPAESLNYFDLEDPVSLARLDEPMTALAGLRGLVVIDEVQRRPELFPMLRVLADRTPLPARFLVLGSASPDLLRQSSESLAGRLETIILSGFSLIEVGVAAQTRHWVRGGFPRAFLARSLAECVAWRKQFIQAFLERDLPQLGVTIPAPALLRFWTMLAHMHGQVWSAADPARSLGVGEPTVRRYLDLLTGLFLVRQLPPWHENLGKRQVKAPKIYFRDSGMLHQLLGIRSEKDLLAHPKCGASWEGYALEETLKATRPDAAYFWATYQGAELDLLLFKSGRRMGVEFKRMDAPTLTPSMRIALRDLRLEGLVVLHPGTASYPLAERVHVTPLAALAGESVDTLFPLRRTGGSRKGSRNFPQKRARPKRGVA
ncbi:MAG TPA: ATP-binding protein [Candidatus Methylomirabilis sp.]|nr:ATP-binding protein [Candidatus Methylomirabilis sp.]